MWPKVFFWTCEITVLQTRYTFPRFEKWLNVLPLFSKALNFAYWDKPLVFVKSVLWILTHNECSWEKNSFLLLHLLNCFQTIHGNTAKKAFTLFNNLVVFLSIGDWIQKTSFKKENACLLFCFLLMLSSVIISDI